jgi:hypothetical protein
VSCHLIGGTPIHLFLLFGLELCRLKFRHAHLFIVELIHEFGEILAEVIQIIILGYVDCVQQVHACLEMFLDEFLDFLSALGSDIISIESSIVIHSIIYTSRQYW